MRYLICATYIAILGTISGFSQSSFNASLIEDSLLEGSNAVVRHYTSTYNRESLKSYNIDVHIAVTVLNARGKHAARLVIPYDRNSEVLDIKGTVYDENGIALSKLKKKDLKDYPSNASFTLFSDNRVKTVSPSINSYPFTVEYSYRTKHSATVGFGNWMPLKWFNTSTEHAELHVITPDDLDIRYQAMNHPFEFSADTTGEVYTYSWSAHNLKAVRSEPYLPLYLDFMPVVMLAPNDISYEGTTGSYQTWNDYGKWVYSLIENRDHLSEETVARMKQLTDTISDKREKVKAVYQYMQSRTRYVNVALGIGGFQPLHAFEVDEKGYGDCKALSNYTRALLKCVGITAYYTEIGSGRTRELKYPDFASVNQTNHVILCVPLDQDTVWMECTSQSIPFGYIGISNSNRYALLVSEAGGVLARTPVYPSSENLRISTSSIDLDNVGNARYKVSADFINTEYDDISGLLELSRKEQNDALVKYLTHEGFEMENFDILEYTSDNPAARILLEGDVTKFASKSGKRLFLRSEYLFNQVSFKDIAEDRDLSICRQVGYQHIDSVSITLPENFRVERLPEDVSIDSDFGTYTLNVSESSNGVHICRVMELFSGCYPRTKFAALNSFTEAVRKSDQSRIIICHP